MMNRKMYIKNGTRFLIAGITCALAVSAIHAETEPIDDSKILESVKTALKDFPPTSDTEPELEVEDGVLKLSGEVDSLPVKNLAAETAATIRGVRAIVNELTVREVEKDDDTIQKQLDDVFTLHNANEDKAIEYRVNDGVVTLNGSISTYTMKRQAEKMASSVAGVRSVVNLLRVMPLTLPDDKEITQNIALRLGSNPWIDSELVKMTVEDGVVSLYGAVDSYAERSQLIELARAYGIKEVNAEKLTVSPGLRPKMHRPHKPLFRTDEELKTSLTDAFHQDNRLHKSDIKIKVLDSDITLVGSVDNIGAKAAAESNAGNLPGAGQVYSFLTIANQEGRSDADIEDRLNRTLQANALLGGTDVSAKVEDNVVTLEGMVNSTYQRRHAVNIASNASGIREVKSKLRVDWDSDTTPKN